MPSFAVQRRACAVERNEAFLTAVSAFLRNEKAELSLSEELWRELMVLAEQQKLLPAVLEAVGGSMPKTLTDDAKRRVRLLVAEQLRRTEEFKKTYSELNERGLLPLVVKGIVCRSVYAKPDMRSSSDEDLYICGDYERFHSAMTEMGFAASEPDYKNDHEARYTRNGLLIEGHWELFPKTNSVLDSFNELTDSFWSRAQTVTVEGISIKTLSPTDHFVFLLLHAFKHFVNSGVGIRQLCDVAQWAKHYEIDYDSVRKIAKNARAEKFCSAVFDAGERYFGMSFPEGWERVDSTALIVDALDGGIYGSADMDRKHSGNMTLGALAASRNDKKAFPLLNAMFPPRRVMEHSYPWVQKSTLLLPAAWTLRAVRYLKHGDRSASESIKLGNDRIELLKMYDII